MVVGSSEIWPCDTNKCSSNMIFAFLIWMNSVLSFMQNYLEYILCVRFTKCVCGRFSKEYTLPKRKNIKTQRKNFPIRYYKCPVSHVFTCFCWGCMHIVHVGQARGQYGWILAEFSSKKRTRPIPSHLDRTTLVNKRFTIWHKKH